jgi:phage baseplate assembly protein W
MAKITFDTQTCRRCGGSGHYSYCERFGTVCFDCKGKTTVLSKRGHAAALAVAAERERVCGIPVADLTVGALIRYEGRVRLVTAIRDGGSSTSLQGVVTPYLHLTLAPRTGQPWEVTSVGFATTARVVLKNTPEQWEALVAFADTLPGALVDGQPSTAMAKADAAAAKRAATKAAKAALAVSA